MTQAHIRVFDSLTAAETVWRDLERDGCSYVFQSYDWVRVWHETVGTQRRITPCPALVSSPEGNPLLLLPLAIRRLGMLRVLTWIGNEMADYLGPLLANDFAARATQFEFTEIWTEVLGLLPKHDLFLLERQPAMINGTENPFIMLGHAPHSANAYFTLVGSSVEELLRSHRSGRSLRTDRRKHKRLNDRGLLEFVVVDTPEKLARFLPEMMAQKSRSYLAMGVTDLFASPEHRACIERFSNRFPQSVGFFALSLDDTTIATLWGLLHAGRYYHLFPTYLPGELSRYSPGNVLLRYVFEWCVNNDIEIYDFTVGDEEYKLHWCDQELQLFDSIRATTMRGQIPVLFLRAQRWVKRRIKGSPRLFRFVQRVRARL